MINNRVFRLWLHLNMFGFFRMSLMNALHSISSLLMASRMQNYKQMEVKYDNMRETICLHISTCKSVATFNVFVVGNFITVSNLMGIFKTFHWDKEESLMPQLSGEWIFCRGRNSFKMFLPSLTTCLLCKFFSFRPNPFFKGATHTGKHRKSHKWSPFEKWQDPWKCIYFP